jgi:hypothetical protein
MDFIGYPLELQIRAFQELKEKTMICLGRNRIRTQARKSKLGLNVTPAEYSSTAQLGLTTLVLFPKLTCGRYALVQR